MAVPDWGVRRMSARQGRPITQEKRDSVASNDYNST